MIEFAKAHPQFTTFCIIATVYFAVFLLTLLDNEKHED